MGRATRGGVRPFREAGLWCSVDRGSSYTKADSLGGFGGGFVRGKLAAGAPLARRIGVLRLALSARSPSYFPGTLFRLGGLPPSSTGDCSRAKKRPTAAPSVARTTIVGLD